MLSELVTSDKLKVEDYYQAFTLPAPYEYVELLQNGAGMAVNLENA